MQIDYYYSLMSPWAYFGAPRLYELQDKYGLTINHFPLDLIKLFYGTDSSTTTRRFS